MIAEINKDHAHEDKQVICSELAILRESAAITCISQRHRGVKNPHSKKKKKRTGRRFQTGFNHRLLAWGRWGQVN